MPSVGPLELAIVLLIVMLLFGAKRLPELGRSAGKGIRELKSGLNITEGSETGRQERGSPERRG